MTTVAILGNDAVLAARPATAVQLAHACLRAGFDAAVPASWGDELVAAESARQLQERGEGVAILCACPHVEARLLAPGPDLAPLLVPVVAPPVAAGRYLRRLHAGRPVRVTYVGACPGAAADAASSAPSINEQIEPAAFLRGLDELGVRLAEQPTVYDSVLPPDRRRFCSLPGGVPAPSCLWEGEQSARTLIEIEGADYKAELAQQILAHRRAVIDLAPRLGCACSGAGWATPHTSARAAVLATEPPRATGPVVEPLAGLDLARRVAAPPPPVRVVDAPRPAAAPAPARQKRATPSGIFRAYTGQVPTTRSPDGRPVPRAYAAHRRTPAATNRAVGEATGSLPALPAASPVPASPVPVSPVPVSPPTSPVAEPRPEGVGAPSVDRPSRGATWTMPPRRNPFAFLAFEPPSGGGDSGGGDGREGASADGPDGTRGGASGASGPAAGAAVRVASSTRGSVERRTPVVARRVVVAAPRARRRRMAPVVVGAIVLLAAAGAAVAVVARRFAEAAGRHPRGSRGGVGVEPGAAPQIIFSPAPAVSAGSSLPGPAREDSFVDAERERIRRELVERRARIDSSQRLLESSRSPRP